MAANSYSERRFLIFCATISEEPDVALLTGIPAKFQLYLDAILITLTARRQGRMLAKNIKKPICATVFKIKGLE